MYLAGLQSCLGQTRGKMGCEAVPPRICKSSPSVRHRHLFGQTVRTVPPITRPTVQPAATSPG